MVKSEAIENKIQHQAEALLVEVLLQLSKVPRLPK